MSQAPSRTLAVALLSSLVATAGFAQTAPAPATTTAPQTLSRGTVVSSTRSTLVIRNDDGQYELFVLDSNTTRPPAIPPRSSVTVASTPSPADQAPKANLIRVTAPPPAQAPPQGGVAPPPPDEPIPPSVRRLESSVQRQARRWRIGARGGVGLDPEIVMIGAQTQLGPFFSDSVWARPSIEFGFGEVTTLIALNFEGLYRLPITPETDRWHAFVGAGPALNFAKLGLPNEATDEIDDRFSFSDLNLDVGINVFIGMQSRGGMFMELRGTAYSTPHLRFSIGYNF